jgi:hypothetical protein
MKIQFLLLIVPGVALFAAAGRPDRKFTEAPELPVTIRYMQTVPPDTIADFLKVCFTMQKVRVVDTAESRRILREHMESLFNAQRELLQSDNWSLEKSQKIIEEAKKLPLNILEVKFFPNHSSISGDYNLDSINWQIRSPDRDTVFYRYKPQFLGQPIYSVLKNFTDTVIASGLLR